MAIHLETTLSERRRAAVLRAVTDGIVSVNGNPLTETVSGFQLTATLTHGTETVNETRGHCGYWKE